MGTLEYVLWKGGGMTDRVLRDVSPVCEDERLDAVLQRLLTTIGDKWTLAVVSVLVDGEQRPAAILRRIDGLSQRMLTKTLRDLERDGLVSRTVYAEVPPRVEYALTPLGRTLLEPIDGLLRWVEDYGETVLANRARWLDRFSSCDAGLPPTRRRGNGEARLVAVPVMSRAVIRESFGGPETLHVQEVPEPHAGRGQLRVRVAAAGLNPVDWIKGSSAETAARFGLTLPAGFGSDFAGTVDETGDGVTGFAVGDRVFGGARDRAVADLVVVTPGEDELHHTPDGVDDVTAAALDIAGRTAAAALDAIQAGEGDTVLVGGAAGGVGVLAVQLARLAGARVIGTGSAESAGFLRSLGAEPVPYGDGLADRVRTLAPDGITAATDLFGTETAYAALELGVPAGRISTIAAFGPELPFQATGGVHAAPDALDRIATLIAEGRLTVPIAARYPITQIRDAVAFQATRHAHGKVVVVL
jgi:NADPH:quinone reductase-like Zn-dependent oxidoreductase/DNA-binding HxlR family transcriptional regulator